jgi:hypothetical protein
MEGPLPIPDDVRDAMLRDLQEQVAVIKDHLELPMTYLEILIAREAAERRKEEIEAQQRRWKAYEEAKAEAERVGHRGPFDELSRRLHAGEFDRVRPGC